MIEPTETETRETLDAFIEAMRQIAHEAANDPDKVKNAPHDTPVSHPDDTEAALTPILTWSDLMSHTKKHKYGHYTQPIACHRSRTGRIRNSCRAGRTRPQRHHHRTRSKRRDMPQSRMHTHQCLSDAAGQLPAAPPSEDTPRPYNDLWQKARAKADAVVDALRDDVDALLRGCRVVHGSAKITPQGTVEVNGTEYSADRILIATGSAPATLDIPGAAFAITSDDILSAATLPPAIAVIGGGVIALELADILGAFGVAVTVLEYCPEILPAFEADVAKRLRSTLSRRGIKFVVGARVSAICRDADGGILHVQYTDAKGRDAEVSAPAVLMAVGRRAVIPDGCAEAGIDTDRRGCIVTDDNFQTTREEIYAVGDANGKCMLAHAATAQAHRALGADVDLSVMPSAVFTHPEVAMVGMTTEACKTPE